MTEQEIEAMVDRIPSLLHGKTYLNERMELGQIVVDLGREARNARAEVEALRAQVAELTKQRDRVVDLVEKGAAGHSPYEACGCAWCTWYAALGTVAK